MRRAYPAFPLLAQLLPGATRVGMTGSRRAWFAMAEPLGEDREGEAPVGGARDAELPFSPGTLSRLMLAAQADGDRPFCEELRIYRRDQLVLRWAAPLGGSLRVAGEVAEGAVFQFAALAGGTYRRGLAPL